MLFFVTNRNLFLINFNTQIVLKLINDSYLFIRRVLKILKSPVDQNVTCWIGLYSRVRHGMNGLWAWGNMFAVRSVYTRRMIFYLISNTKLYINKINSREIIFFNADGRSDQILKVFITNDKRHLHFDSGTLVLDWK